MVALFAYLFLPALCLTFAGPALPAESIHVVIRFKPGVISFPAQDQGPGYGFEATLADAEIAIPGLRGTLAELGVVSFETIGATWRHVQNPVLNRHGIPVNLVDFTDVYNVTFEGPAADSLLARLRRAPGLSYARIPRPFKVGFPNDPYYESGELWHLNNTGQTYEGEPCTPDLDIDADSAWAIATGPGTKIAFLDLGVDPDHDDLAASIDQVLSRGFGPNPSWVETCYSMSSHGTPVAGIALARGNNQIGVASIANTPVGGTPYPIVALNIMLSCEGIVSDVLAVEALEHVVDPSVYPGILITNNSWFGAHCFWSSDEEWLFPPELRDAFRNCYLLDISSFACVGNGDPACAGFGGRKCNQSRCWHFPAAFDDYCFGVRGISCTGGNPGPSQASGFWVDATAPARVTTTSGTQGSGEEYRVFGGCSGATPLVAGIAALLLRRNPDLTNDDIYNLIRSTCVDWGATGWDETYGSGLVKADDALRLLDPPYRLFHEAAHQFTYEDLGVRQQWFMNIDDLTTEEDLWQEFRARVYRLRIDAPFPGAGSGADPIQGVWGRGVGSMGARDLDSLDARFWAPYVAVDSATVTPRGCTLETYTYKVYDAAGRVFKCWYPVPIGAGLVCSAPPWGTPTFLYSYVADTTGAGRVAPPGSLPESDGEKRGRAEQPSMVTFELARPGVGSVIVHNVFGREVRGLAREIYLSRGTHSYKWDGKDSAGRLVPSGVYFISLRCGPENTVRRVCVIH